MDERIISFIRSQTNLTLAVSEDDVPYCANCFYAYSEKENLLIFKSKKETNHIRVALRNKHVAGTIVSDSLVMMRIQGVQFTGIFIQPTDKSFEQAGNIYYKRYPFAKVLSGEIWMIELLAIKFTDNKMGFGKKLNWSR